MSLPLLGDSVIASEAKPSITSDGWLRRADGTPRNDVTEPMLHDIDNLTSYEAQLAQGLSLKPLLYFYTWPQASLSAGKLQLANSSRRAKLLELSERLALPLVERPTGGRLVLHGGDICYTFIAALNDKDFGGDLRSSFCKVNNYVFNSLREIDSFKTFFEQGLLATVIAGDSFVIASEAKQPILNMDKINCFASSVGGEAVIASAAKQSTVSDGLLRCARNDGGDGLLRRGAPRNDQVQKTPCNDSKIIGAAQAMGTSAFIQQGSIQLNRIGVPELEPKLMLSDLRGSDFDIARIRRELNNRVVDLSQDRLPL